MKIIENNPYRQLGVYANSPTKERVANQNRLNAFLEVGKKVDFPLDLPHYLPPINRTSETITQAAAELALPNDQLKYAQFWFIKLTPLDNVAFNHLLAGNMDTAIGIWEKKESASSLQNRIVCALIKNEFDAAIACAERFYTQYSQAFVTAILGAGSDNNAHQSLAFDFIDKLCDEASAGAILPIVTDAQWKGHIIEKQVTSLIASIQSAIDVAKSSRGKGSTARYNAGVKLMNDTKEDLSQLRTYLSTNDVQYQTIADKLGLEILQCAIDYFNDSEEADAAYKSMTLQSYAMQVVVGRMAKDRCKENVDILEGIISQLPPKEVMANHEAIQLALKKFAALPELINHSIQLIKDCAPHIVAIKEKLGRTHQYYLKISTTIVDNALGNVISEVNESLKKKFKILKATLISAWRTQLYLDKFDLEPAYKEGGFKDCRSALYGIIEKCKGFKHYRHSSMYKYGCGWCNNLDVSDVDLRTDDEFFISCRTLDSFIVYLQKFPAGKHVLEAMSKIEELSFKECKTIADYQKFLKDYPNSVYRSEALVAIDKILREEEELSFKECKSVADYQKFLMDYPNSVYRSEALVAIDKILREEKIISACITLNDVLSLYAKEKPKGIDIDKCSNKAFELAKTEEDFQKILSTFGASSYGGQKAKRKIEEFERSRKQKAEARAKTRKRVLWIGILILILGSVFLIWGIGGISITCYIIAVLSGLSVFSAFGSRNENDGCTTIFNAVAIAIVFGLSGYGLENLKIKKEANELYEKIITYPTEEACSDYIKEFEYIHTENTNKVRRVWLNMLMEEAQNFDYESYEEDSSSHKTNPIQKLQNFKDQNNNTYYQNKAESLIKSICDSLYNVADRNSTILGWKQYQNVVPAEYFRDSDKKIEEIENRNWNTEPKAWRQATSENTISAYQKYKSLYPNGAHIDLCEKKLIDLEVSDIFAGEHGTLPEMDRVGYGGGSTSTIKITNSTSYTLTILYSGADSKKIVIEAKGTKTVTLKNGKYRVAVSVSAANVRNYAGTEDLRGGSYSVKYPIWTHSY